MNLEKVYNALPSWLQDLAASAEGWRINRTRIGGAFNDLFSATVERTFWHEENISDYRDQRLRSFIHDCHAATPYYQRLFRECGLSPDDIKDLDSLRCLPILTKQQVQAEYPSLLSNALPSSKRIIAHTSGTTGGGLRFATTREALQEQWAVWCRYRSWHGLPRYLVRLFWWEIGDSTGPSSLHFGDVIIRANRFVQRLSYEPDESKSLHFSISAKSSSMDTWISVTDSAACFTHIVNVR